MPVDHSNPFLNQPLQIKAFQMLSVLMVQLLPTIHLLLLRLQIWTWYFANNSYRSIDLRLTEASLKNDFVLESVEAANLSIKECFDILDTGKIPSQPLSENQHIQKCQKEFLDKIYHQKKSQKFADPMFHCEVCKERWLKPTRKVRVSRSTSRRTSNGHGGQYQCQTCGKSCESYQYQQRH